MFCSQQGTRVTPAKQTICCMPSDANAPISMPPQRQPFGTWEQMCGQSRKRHRVAESESDHDVESDDGLSTVSDVARARQLSPPPSHTTTLARAGPPQKRRASAIRRTSSGISTSTMSSTTTLPVARRIGGPRGLTDDDARSSVSVDSIGARSSAASHPFLGRPRARPQQMRWEDEELYGLGDVATGAAPWVAFGSNKGA